MKKIIFFLSLILISIGAIAQPKKDTVKTKPEFRPDPSKLYSLPPLTANEIVILTMTPEDWKSVEWDSKATGQQIQQYKAGADDLRKKIKSFLLDQQNADFKKWQDTTGKHLKIKGT